MWANHQLLEIFILYEVIFSVPECYNILFDALDFVLRVLHNNLVILILYTSRPLHSIIHLALGPYVQLAVMTLALLLELKRLSLQQFLLDEHSSEDKSVQKVLIRPIRKK